MCINNALPDFTFSRDDTKIIKAIAIILMFMYHLWAFPDRICGGELKYFVTLFNEPLFKFFGKTGRFCLSLFFFLGGYGIFMSCKNKEYDLICKIKNLYLDYWKVFLVFIPIAFIFFSNQPIFCKDVGGCTRYNNFQFKVFIESFLGISRKYNNSWWFFFHYVIACVSFPLIRKVFKHFSFSINLLLVIILTLLFASVFPYLGKMTAFSSLDDNELYSLFFLQGLHSKYSYTGCFFMGIAMAKDNILVTLKSKMYHNNLLNPLVNVCIIFAVLYLKRYKFSDSSMDIFLAPIFCIAVCDIVNRIS